MFPVLTKNLKPIGGEKISSQKESDCVRKLISSPKLFEMNKWRNIFLTKCKCLGEKVISSLNVFILCEKIYFVTQFI